jgi:hypothetical protein
MPGRHWVENMTLQPLESVAPMPGRERQCQAPSAEESRGVD